MTDQDQSSPESQQFSYPLSFRFRLGSARFDANVTKQERGIHLRLKGSIGDVPYSVEGADHRAEILKTIAEKGPDSPWVITQDQRLVLNTEFYLSGQPSLVRFVSEALNAALVRAPAAITAPI